MMKLLHIVALAVLAACALGSPAAAQARRAVTFQLDFLINGYHAPFFLALERGWYREAGLDVTIRPGRGSVDTARLVGTGNADFGMVDSMVATRAIGEGVGMIVVAMVVSDSPSGIVTFGDAGVRAPRDLEGKTIATSPIGATGRLLPGFLRLNQVDAARVRLQEFNVGTTVPAFIAGQADGTIGFLFGEYLTAQQNARGRAVSFLRFADFGMNPYSVGIVARPELVSGNPEVVRGFVQASVRGIRHAIANVDEAVGVLARQTETSRDMLKAQLESAITLINTAEAQRLGIGVMSPERWNETQRLAIEFFDQRARIEPDRLYTNRFVQQ